MTKEEKQLLLKDLCARLPYGVKINHIIYNWEGTCINFNRKLRSFAIEKDNGLCYDVPVEEIRPYLCPMSSMTEEERKELSIILNYEFYVDDDFALVAEDDRHRIRLELCEDYIDWLVSHHFDYRGLIPMNLALEAKEGMYKTE